MDLFPVEPVGKGERERERERERGEIKGIYVHSCKCVSLKCLGRAAAGNNNSKRKQETGNGRQKQNILPIYGP
jgi:hypothetical protein